MKQRNLLSIVFLQLLSTGTVVHLRRSKAIKLGCMGAQRNRLPLLQSRLQHFSKSHPI